MGTKKQISFMRLTIMCGMIHIYSEYIWTDFLRDVCINKQNTFYGIIIVHLTEGAAMERQQIDGALWLH